MTFQPPPLTVRNRTLLALAVSVACVMYVLAHGTANPQFTSDFDQLWAGARALWQHKDPYAVVGPGREFGWNWPLYYPLPALIVVSPLGMLPVLIARGVFAGLSSFLFVWSITRDNWSRLPVLLSVSFIITIELGQWSAIYAAAFFLPAAAAIASVKPNFGVALIAAGGRRTVFWVLGGTFVLLTVSQLVQPGWHESWMENLRSAPHFKSHIQRPLGFLLLLAALKWRRPEARWMLALAIIPQAPSFYDQLLLTALCLERKEAVLFAATTVLLYFYVGYHTIFEPQQVPYLTWGRIVGNGTLWICYLPMLAILLTRPNEGPVPPWVDRVVQRFRIASASRQSPGS